MPIVRSTHECEQQVNRAGVIAQASCKEKHVFRPFSRDNSGATTEVEFTLAFQKEIKRTTTRVGQLPPCMVTSHKLFTIKKANWFCFPILKNFFIHD